MILLLVLALLGIAVSRLVYGAIYNVFFHPLHHLPGPLLWRAFDLPFIRSKLRGTSHKDLLELHQRYGDTVRVAPYEVSHVNGKVWQEVWGHNKDPEFYKGISAETPDTCFPRANQNRYNGSPGILTADRGNHRRFRHLLSNSFSASAMAVQEARIQHYIDLLMRQLAEHGTKEPINIVTWMNWTTFDIIGDLSFGESFGCLEHVRTNPWVESLLGLMRFAQWATAINDYGLSPLLNYILPKSVLDSRRRAYEYYHAAVARRVEYGADRGDFLDPILQHPLLSAKEAAETPAHLKRGMTLHELESNASNMVLAGSETTATLLSGAIFHLLSNPRVLHKLQASIRQTFSSADEITMLSATSKLPYLLHVLDETLRIYNPVPFLTSRTVPQVPAGGATIAGNFYPTNTRIHILAYPSYHMERNFARPEEFVPERWMPRATDEKGGDGTTTETRDPVFDNDNPDGIFQPFSAGPRNCIGRNLAYAEMRVVLSKLLWWFDLSVPKHEKGVDWEGWVEDQKVYLLWEKGPLWVEVRKRTDL